MAHNVAWIVLNFGIPFRYNALMRSKIPKYTAIGRTLKKIKISNYKFYSLYSTFSSQQWYVSKIHKIQTFISVEYWSPCRCYYYLHNTQNLDSEFQAHFLKHGGDIVINHFGSALSCPTPISHLSAALSPHSFLPQ